MPIGFRCTGCRSRLHVPKRWAGNTLACPKCGTRVVVPEAGGEPTAFEDKAVERSLASLNVPRVGKTGGIFAEDSFELPSPDDIQESLLKQERGKDLITLSRRALYAYLAMIPVIAVAAFLLGYWCTAAWSH